MMGVKKKIIIWVKVQNGDTWLRRWDCFLAFYVPLETKAKTKEGKYWPLLKTTNTNDYKTTEILILLLFFKKITFFHPFFFHYWNNNSQMATTVNFE